MAVKPIVVGTDGSESALRAVDWAAREAALRDVPLRIVAVRALDQRTDWLTPADPRAAEARQAAEKALEDAADQAYLAAHGRLIDTALLTGDPAAMLAGAAGNASLLVVGSRGASGLAVLAFGSVSRHLAVHSPSPLVIVHDEATPVHHQIVVGIRDLGASEEPLAFAFDEASHRGAHLLVVQAWYWFPPPGTPQKVITPGQVSGEALIRLFRMLEPWRDKYPDVEVGEEILHVRPGQALTELSASADLLVLGRHQGTAGALAPPAGSVTHAVLNRARGPVAIIPGKAG